MATRDTEMIVARLLGLDQIFVQALLLRDGGGGLEQTLHNSVVKASCDLLSSLQIVLQQNTVPGRYHYCFNVTTIVNIVKVLDTEKRQLFQSPI